MKKSDIKINNLNIIKYCKNENKMQQRVYSLKVQKRTMSEYEANRRYLIIENLGILARLLEQKGKTWNELTKMVESLPDKRQLK